MTNMQLAVIAQLRQIALDGFVKFSVERVGNRGQEDQDGLGASFIWLVVQGLGRLGNFKLVLGTDGLLVEVAGNGGHGNSRQLGNFGKGDFHASSFLIKLLEIIALIPDIIRLSLDFFCKKTGGNSKSGQDFVNWRQQENKAL